MNKYQHKMLYMFDPEYREEWDALQRAIKDVVPSYSQVMVNNLGLFAGFNNILLMWTKNLILYFLLYLGFIAVSYFIHSAPRRNLERKFMRNWNDKQA